MKVLNEFQTAEQLSLAVQTLRNWRHEGRGLPYVRIGERRVGYIDEDVKNFALSRRVVPTNGESAG